MRRFAADSPTRSLTAALVVLSLVLGFLALVGCGQMGPLTLEERPADTATDTETDTESDTEEDER